MMFTSYQFEFHTAVHFGKSNLSDGEYVFYADTLFSALCHEAISIGEDKLHCFVEKTKAGDIIFSDGFPYIGDTFYVPKPLKKVDVKKDRGESTVKKAFKKLKYIPVDLLEEYVSGNLDGEKEEKRLKELGKFYLKTAVNLMEKKEAVPYHIGTYRFAQGNGLYIFVGYQRESDREWVESLLESLSYTGIGGKRTSGLGKFVLKRVTIQDTVLQRLMSPGPKGMSLSVCMPREEELEEVVKGANYLLLKRSGFVLSDTYVNKQRKKRDFYSFQSGSYFHKRFHGDVYDVSNGGKDSVYRYGKPLFMEVDR